MKLETQTEQLISETVTVYGLSPQIGVHALAQTVNALAAQGAVFSVCPDSRHLLSRFTLVLSYHAGQRTASEFCRWSFFRAIRFWIKGGWFSVSK